MSKTIKVSDQVYEELEGMIRPRESFSQVIERILEVYRTIRGVSDTLGPRHPLNNRELVQGGGR